MDAKDKLLDLLTRPTLLRLAVAESLTSGYLQAVLSTIPNISKAYEGGLTAYTLEQKVRHLNVDQEHARQNYCVSARVAREMAFGICDAFDTDLGIGTTGYVAPCHEEGAEKPFALWALCHRVGGVHSIVGHGRIAAGGTIGEAMQAKVANELLEELVAYLERFRSGNPEALLPHRPDPPRPS